jgi:hypothetical protein
LYGHYTHNGQYYPHGFPVPPSKLFVLTDLFGEAVKDIRQTFFNLEPSVLEKVLLRYGAIYGQAAEKYARKTLWSWKYGSTKLSGQTIERLIKLVPPYLSPDQRFALLQVVLKRHKKTVSRSVTIDIKQSAKGFAEVRQVLAAMSHTDMLANLPGRVMEAAQWLYANDMTAARAMLAEAERRENDVIRANAGRELELLRQTIATGKVRSASYAIAMPAGTLNVYIYTPNWLISMFRSVF